MSSLNEPNRIPEWAEKNRYPRKVGRISKRIHEVPKVTYALLSAFDASTCRLQY